MKQACLSFALAGLLLAATAAGAGAIGVGQQSPQFSLETIEGGQTVSFQEDLKGTPSLLVFWATWCGHCRTQLPNVDRLAKEYGEQGVRFLGINVGARDTRSRAASYLQENGIVELPMVFDSGSQVTRKFGLRGVPTFILLDAKGTVLHKGVSVSQELMAKLDRLAGGK